MFKDLLRLLLLAVSLTSFLFPASSALARGGGGSNSTTKLTTFETADFTGSGICTKCHSRLFSLTGEEVSHDVDWRSSMMANAAKDPLWLAKVNSEVVRNPHLQAVIEEKCARCHMGMARYQAYTDNEDIGIIDDGFLNPDHPLNQAAMDGVSCSLCHQIQDDALGEEDCFTGKYMIDTSTSPHDRVIFGPYPQPVGSIMEEYTGFFPLHSDRMKESKLCSTCHTLYTPTVRADGTVVEGKEFPEQMTFLEWEHSDFSRSDPAAITCPSCHIPEAFSPSVISNRPKKLAVREHVGQHHFVGGNSFMVELLKHNAKELGVTAEATHFDHTILLTNSQLAQETATITASAAIVQRKLNLTITVANLIGHKLPTGIPIRRLWLHVLVVDTATDTTIFESGRPLPDGRIEGNDADEDSSTFEPHYTAITDASQVQIYEGIMHNTDAEVTQTLLRASTYAKDNRLLPRGFDKDAYGIDDFGVYGGAKEDADFIGGQDTVTYQQIHLADAVGPCVVTMNLLYQSLAYPFINDFTEDDVEHEDLVESFMQQYNKEDKVPVLVTTAELTVQNEVDRQ